MSQTVVQNLIPDTMNDIIVYAYKDLISLPTVKDFHLSKGEILDLLFYNNIFLMEKYVDDFILYKK